MSEIMSRKDRGIEMANEMAGEDTEIEFWKTTESGSLSFKYDGGCIHANRLTEDWELTGFASGFFSIK